MRTVDPVQSTVCLEFRHVLKFQKTGVIDVALHTYISMQHDYDVLLLDYILIYEGRK